MNHLNTQLTAMNAPIVILFAIWIGLLIYGAVKGFDVKKD